MKKLLLAFAALAVIYACNKENHGDANLHITGTVKGLSQGTLYIQRVVDTTLVAMDTIVIKGKSDFESHLKIDSPEMLYLFLDRGQTNSIDNNLPFFAEPGNMRIETANEEFFAKAKITGSKNHKLYEDFSNAKRRFTGQNAELIKKNLEGSMKGNVAQLDSVSLEQEKLLKRRYLFTVNYALNHAKYDVGPYLALSEIYDANVKYLDTIAKAMSPQVAKSHYGKMLTKYVADRKKAQIENAE